MDIEIANQWLDEYRNRIHGTEFIHEDRKVVSLSLLQLALEHNAAIITLIKSDMHSSAFALLRPQRDAFLRGIWMFRCASDKQLLDFMSGEQPPGINVQLKQVETLDDYSHGKLSALMSDIKEYLHDFTHGGLYQAASHDKGDRISGGYTPDQIDWFLRQSILLSFLTCLEVCHVCNDTSRSHELTTVFNKLIKSAK